MTIEYIAAPCCGNPIDLRCVNEKGEIVNSSHVCYKVKWCTAHTHDVEYSGLPLDCELPERHDGPHVCHVKNLRITWEPQSPDPWNQINVMEVKDA